MKISIITSVYNVQDYIVECLKSIDNQTFNGEIEAIIVDDCGTDNSMSYAREFIKNKKSNVDYKIIVHEKNMGPSCGRNTAIDNATGDYIFIVDSDDALTPNVLELMAEQVKMHPDVELVQGQIVVDKEKDNFYNIERYNKCGYVNDNNWIRREFYKATDTYPTSPCCKLLKLDFIKKNNLYFRPGIIHEDQLWMYHVAKKLQKIAFVFEPGYIHYRNPNSIMSSSKIEKSQRDFGYILDEVLQNLDEPFYNMQLTKYAIMFINRQNNSPEHRTINDTLRKLCKERGFSIGSLLLLLTKSFNCAITRIMARKYFKFYNSKLS